MTSFPGSVRPEKFHPLRKQELKLLDNFNPKMSASDSIKLLEYLIPPAAAKPNDKNSLTQYPKANTLSNHHCMGHTAWAAKGP